MYDLLLRGGLILDGTGAPARPGDVAVTGGRLAAVAEPGAITEAARVLEVPGRAVAPGFLDLHAHHDLLVLAEPLMEAPLLQGVTLQVNGQCGISAYPMPAARQAALREALPVFGAGGDWGWESVGAYLDDLRQARPAINVSSLVGHGTLRAGVVGFEPRPLTEAELQRLEAATAEALAQGASGVSFGLIYPPGSWAPTEEVLRIARVAAEHGKIACFHIRGEDERLEGSLAEVIAVGEQSGARVQVSHLKASGQASWGHMPRALELIEAAHDRGVAIGFDHYPYTAGSTYLSSYLPGWVLEGGWPATSARLRDPATRRRLAEHLAVVESGADYSRMMISAVATEAHRDLIGLRVTQAAERAGQDLPTFLAEFLLAENNAVMVIIFSMCDEDMELALVHPLGVLGTDSLAASGPGQASHPRCYGSAPRILGRYVRERGLLSLEEAVRKLTSAPADRLGLPDRGRIAVGAAADLVVFDRATILDTGTYENPWQVPVGIDYVLVNGQIAAEKGQATGVRVGEVL